VKVRVTLNVLNVMVMENKWVMVNGKIVMNVAEVEK
jgi:hypothetical protein